MWTEISNYNLGAEFLIAGFDQVGTQHLFGVFDASISPILHYTGVGYAAIGVGADHALHDLAFRNYNWGSVSLIEALYLVCEAKFVGEGAFVGRDTIVSALRQNEGASFFLRGDHPIRLLTKQGRRFDVEQQIGPLIQWALLTT